MAVASFGTLVSDSWSFCKTHRMSLIIGAVILGLVGGVVQSTMNMQVAGMARNPLEKMGMNIDMDRMEDLQERAQSGDTAAMRELQEEAAKMAQQFEGKSDAEIRDMVMGEMGWIAGVGSFMSMFTLLMLLVMSVANTYFTLFALAQKDDAAALWSAVPKYILPMIGLQLWMFVRSFVWIPLAGLVLVFVFGPRMVLAPVILVGEKKGVFESVTISISRTRGYWGKVFGNMLLLGICGILAMIIIGMVLGMLLMFVPYGSAVVSAILGQLFLGFVTVFVVGLNRTLTANPVTN